MQIYLAARYSRREELLKYAADLEILGHQVTARWLQGNHQVDDSGLSLEASREERERFAQDDYEDVLSCSCLIHFTEQPRTPTRGGRHVEMGIAIGQNLRVLVVGPREHVFCCLKFVEVYDTWEQCIEALR